MVCGVNWNSSIGVNLKNVVDNLFDLNVSLYYCSIILRNFLFLTMIMDLKSSST